MHKTSRASLVLGVVILAGLAMVLAGHRSRSHNALRTYKAQLRAKGERLTLEELMRSRDTNANNSQALLTNAVARLRSVRFQPGGPELRKFVRPGQARIMWLEDAPGWDASGPDAEERGWETFVAEVKGVEDTLRQVREALREPAPDAGPPASLLASRRVNFVALRSAAQWLAVVAMSELREGHLDQALENLESEAALARLNRDEYTLVAQMIRIAIANLGLSATWEALQARGWTEPQLARVQRAWALVDLLEALEKGCLGERAVGAEIWIGIRGPNRRQVWTVLFPGSSGSGFRSGSFEQVMRDSVLLPVYKLTSMNQDELFHLQTMQDWVEGVRWLEAHRPWKEAKAKLDGVNARVNQVLSTPGRIRYWISAMATPNLSKATQIAVRAETERQMTLGAIALERYKLRYGRPPAGLQELVPEFLSVMPHDPMSGQPLRCRLRAEGDFVLYSVGEDGRDDGGDPSPATPGKFGLWEGRDAVWPAAASKEVKALPE